MSDKKDRPTSRTGSTISAEDRALFRQAVSGTRRLAQEKRVPPAPARPSPRPRQREQDERAVLRDMFSDPRHPEDLETGEELLFSRIGLQHKTLRRLRRGELAQQAELDLHGLTRLEARQAISAFLQHCRERDYRCVRIIHGKGRGSHQQRAILKQYVDHWLRQVDSVLAYCSARPAHGGTGAIYVLLKKA